jgi:uncharacterized flavoprotein (TIGR03862 family)
MRRLSIIGGGPAGLRAAEIASTSGCEVTLFDAKPSVGRKFLVAGKGGLNITHGELLEKFTTRYTGPAEFWKAALEGFSPADLRQWAADLGVETFQATSGRVYPTALKAAPLLRRWIARLKENGVHFTMNHRLVEVGQTFLSDSSLPQYTLHFADGSIHQTDAIILAMGGASWPQTGSDGSWAGFLTRLGIDVRPLAPANCGWEHEWPEEIIPLIEGQPLKNIHASADGRPAIGELMLTRYGVEGGAIYQLGAVLRAMVDPAITIDFKPTFTEERLIAKMESVKKNFLEEARVRWKLGEPTLALLSLGHYPDIQSLAAAVKNFRLPLTRPRPIDEAISSAGGVEWGEIDENLMLRKAPGIFLAGEMIDWEAPTGGYLMQGCFATGTRAANAADDWLKQR